MVNKIIDANTFVEIISEYMKNKLNKTIDIKIDLGTYYDALGIGASIKLYYETLEENKSKKEIISEVEIKEALSKYVESESYQLGSYRYIGGVRRMGLFIPEDTPHFEGINLKLIEKNSVLQRKK